VKGDKKKKFDGEKFKETNTVATYEERIRGELLLEGEFVEEKWRNIKNVISRTAETVLGTAECKTKSPWFDEECKMIALEVREVARIGYIREKTRASQEV
jgi:hypothetical protein